MLDNLVTSLGKVGLKLNAAKTKALTTQAQPPKTLTTRAGLEIAMLDQSSSHKWLGCMLSTENAGTRQDDIDHRLQSAARAFHVHKWILCDKRASMASRLKFFDAMITSVVCFAAGHRKIYTIDLRKLDVHCRKLLRRVVGPPADINWNQPWHTILHAWHRRIDQQLEYHGFKMWSMKYFSEYWKFASCDALLDDNRWVKRILHWNPRGGRPGRPLFAWQTPLQNFCRWHHLGTWLDIARNTDLWFFSTAECSIARTALLVSLQALDTMVTIYIPAAPGCAKESAKSKPVSLGGGWKSGVAGGAGDFSKDLTDGRGVAFEVVAAKFVLVKEGCCKGMHGRMREHGAPAVDQGVGEGMAAEGLGFGGIWCGQATSGKLHHPNVPQLQSQRQQGDIADPGGVWGRCVPCSSSRPLELCLCIALPAFVGARLV